MSPVVDTSNPWPRQTPLVCAATIEGEIELAAAVAEGETEGVCVGIVDARAELTGRDELLDVKVVEVFVAGAWVPGSVEVVTETETGITEVVKLVV
jgi:hypothetical protein